MKKKSLLLGIICISVLFSSLVWAQDYKISVNQFVEHPALDSVLKGMQDYLKEHSVTTTYKVRIAQANMATANQIARQMVSEESDLMVAIATPSAQACAQALKNAPKSQKRPFVFTAITDPVAAGLVKDLNNPGGMITGVSDLLPVKRHIDMILEFKPETKRIGVLYNAGEANSKSTVGALKKIGKEMGIDIIDATAAKTADVYQAAKSIVGRVDAVFIPTDNTIVAALESVIKIGAQNKLPIFASDVDSVERGALAAIGFDYYKHGYQTGAMVERILNGAPPATTPVEFQKDLQFQINAASALLMGVTPPRAALDRATKVYK